MWRTQYENLLNQLEKRKSQCSSDDAEKLEKEQEEITQRAARDGFTVIRYVDYFLVRSADGSSHSSSRISP